MSSNTQTRWAGLWMDQFKASIVMPKDGDCELIQIYSDLESQHHSTGGKGKSHPYMHETGPYSMARFEAKQQNKQRDYFEELASTLQNVDHLLLMGIGLAPKTFAHFLQKVPSLASMQVTIEKVEAMSLQQLIHRVRTHFGRAAPRKLAEHPGQPAHQS